jgi:uncharacterized protein YggU (UPF0235/DUF167 family)
MVELTAHPAGTILAVRAQPGANQDRILGERAGALRVAVSAAPERGKANEAIRGVLADAIPCKVSQIGLLAGQTSRMKRFLIAGLIPDELRPRIDVLVVDPG